MSEVRPLEIPLYLYPTPLRNTFPVWTVKPVKEAAKPVNCPVNCQTCQLSCQLSNMSTILSTVKPVKPGLYWYGGMRLACTMPSLSAMWSANIYQYSILCRDRLFSCVYLMFPYKIRALIFIMLHTMFPCRILALIFSMLHTCLLYTSPSPRD